jgi:antitoxin component YwqK of YwqJK toxin-antitoxin module
MIREEQIKQQADKYNSEDFGEDITSIISERIAFIEGAKWADANPNKKLVYTKQELLDMGFGFDLNGNIRTPNECYESSIKYTEYRKQK